MVDTGSSFAWRRLLAHQEIGLALVMVALFVFTAARSRTVTEFGNDPVTGASVQSERNVFLTKSNLHQILRDASYYAILAVGATFVLVTGGVDLSIGAIFALSAVVAGKFMAMDTLPDSARITLGLIGGIITGALCGFINGALITGLKSPPFLITLGTMQIFRGIAFIITGGYTISNIPASFVSFGKFEMSLGINIHLPLTLLVAAFGVLFLSYSVPGRMALAVGGNEEAARTAGLPVQRVKILVYTLAGVLGGLAGLLHMAYLGSIQSGDGRGYELTVIAAVVIGGASLSGGRGTALGALLGALFLKQINNAIIILEFNQNYEMIVVGLVIVTAAALNRLRERALGAN